MRGVLRSLFGQVVLALLAGALLGWLWPAGAVQMKPLGDGFITTALPTMQRLWNRRPRRRLRPR